MTQQVNDEPVWQLVDNPAALARAAESLSRAQGPVAVDAERASGFRYSQRAYLLQLYRSGTAAFLIDPSALESLDPIRDVIADEEWILHAATQDLPCLRELGLSPRRLFDTELAARLLGMPRVNLAQVVQDLLNVTLTKAHSAADWSTRPLPATWLEYAALDVTYLPALRLALEEQLITHQKLELAEQEFLALTTWQPKPPHPEPWRRMSGLHAITTPRGLAIARELWMARDALARERDVAPGRLLPDRSIIAVAAEPPRSARALAGQKAFVGRASRSELDRWWGAIARAKESEDLPPRTTRSSREIPHHRSWAQRYPDADARLKAARESLNTIAETVNIPVENVLLPDTVRHLAWEPPTTLTEEGVQQLLAQHGARPWQQELTAAALASALSVSSADQQLSTHSQDESA